VGCGLAGREEVSQGFVGFVGLAGSARPARPVRVCQGLSRALGRVEASWGELRQVWTALGSARSSEVQVKSIGAEATRGYQGFPRAAKGWQGRQGPAGGLHEVHAMSNPVGQRTPWEQ